MRKNRAVLNVEQLEDRCVPTLLGQQLFPADNPWNQNIATAPVASYSNAFFSELAATNGNVMLHPDFGQDPVSPPDPAHPIFGIPYNVVHGNSVAKTSVVINPSGFPNESDIAPVPMPANPVLENDFQGGPNPSLAARGDSHLIIFDADNDIAYEFYHASRPSENADGKWHADQETVWNMKTDQFRTLGDTSADAAGLSILAGLIRPDEVQAALNGGPPIDHAIRVTMRSFYILDQYLYPASHVADPGNNNTSFQIPMGTRFRLKASVDISKLDPESRVIAQAMKDYGLILADNGENFFVSGASYSVNANNQSTGTWNNNDIQDAFAGLKSLPASDFEIVDLTPIVTGLSIAQGGQGTKVTVIGENFSGAAGHLQVFFGNTPATSLTYIDDKHLLVTVPAGTGTVDVRVQSGQTKPANSEDFESTIFGYGISKVSVADKFTYLSATRRSI